MGKGLNLNPEGTNVAFVAGTGVLVYIDLIAFLIRHNLGILKGEHAEKLAHPDFKFVIYASF
jgi:hypothetical protein